MKTSKPAPKTSVQEECGVWLDTVQLKGKAKQKRLARPISKLLNPFSGGGGYNVAVALNFTQTKVEMPKTKQSSISTFFTAQRRVLNKLTTSEVPKVDDLGEERVNTGSISALTVPTPVTARKKRIREIHHNSQPDVDHEWNYETVTEPETKVCQKQEASCIPFPNVHCDFKEQAEEINLPQSKRRLISTTSLSEDSQCPPQAWSQDPLLTYSQYTEDELDLTYQENKVTKNFIDSEPSFFGSLQSEEAFDALMEGRTSTQKAFKHLNSSQRDVEKENSRFLSSKSPNKHSTLCHIRSLSSLKTTEPKTSPQKNNPPCPWKQPNQQETPDSKFKWTKKPRLSPLKNQAAQQSHRAVDEDSLAMLFTQDSEGLRVIAHRGLQPRSPLKDQSNISFGAVRSRAFKPMEEEVDEEDMFFTQDSQGHMVIKH
ncbi:aurora kinase A and ninein-interacting protein isoform X1 [Notolabrus celidotus]|nr:aurora kinase A and ninein-interacting protein isoform X1 [Notolabrus celidotus]XP_034560253.1 aurora kinase A and ninein-interacting protein isoform X1 [Notolabrus celidotus]